MSDLVPIDEVVYFDVTTHHPATGAVTDADSTPTFEVFEEATDTDIGVGGNLTKRTSKTGNYRGTFTASAANGFEAGKWYSVIASATVNAIAAKAVAKSFRCAPAESSAGVPIVDTKVLLRRFTAVAVGAQTITFDAGASAEDDAYTPCTIVIESATTGATTSGAGVSYVGSTKVMSMQSPWPIALTGPIVASVYAAGTDPASLTEVAEAVRTEMDANSTKLQTASEALVIIDEVCDTILALLNNNRDEPGQGTPPTNTTAVLKLDYIYKFLVNIKNQSPEAVQFMNAAGTVVDQKSPITINAGVLTRGQIVSGP